MKLDDVPESGNVENRRGQGGGFGGLGGGLPATAGHLGWGGIVLLVIFAILFRVNPMDVLSGKGVAPDQPANSTDVRADDPFVGKILTTTETVWTKEFESGGLKYYNPNVTSYEPPKLVLFADSIDTGCGGATAAVGPFYCPGDSKVYLDTSFFAELRDKFGASGDAANAYVIAHEVGHHVQHLLGITTALDQQRATMSAKDQNASSVRVELQADCFAGVWAHDERDAIQIGDGDIASIVNAATQIGDDRLQKRSQGYVVPDSFTHGTSEQRVRWFKRGFDSGDAKQCDTFHAASL